MWYPCIILERLKRPFVLGCTTHGYANTRVIGQSNEEDVHCFGGVVEMIVPATKRHNVFRFANIKRDVETVRAGSAHRDYVPIGLDSNFWVSGKLFADNGQRFQMLGPDNGRFLRHPSATKRTM